LKRRTSKALERSAVDTTRGETKLIKPHHKQTKEKKKKNKKKKKKKKKKKEQRKNKKKKTRKQKKKKRKNLDRDERAKDREAKTLRKPRLGKTDSEMVVRGVEVRSTSRSQSRGERNLVGGGFGRAR